MAGTSRSDLTPDEATRTGVPASASRSAETSGGSGQPRWTPAEAPGRHEADPGGPAGDEGAADGGRRERPLDGCGGEVSRARLAGGRIEAGKLVLAKPHDDLSFENADRGGNGASVADCPLRGEADLDPLARREPMRHERRLERDDAASRVKRLRRPPPRCGSRHRPELRAAASSCLEPERDPPDEEARRERVTGAGRVERRRSRAWGGPRRPP